MTPDQIKAAYQELETMWVPLDDSPERGLEYFKEQMLLCRRLQEQVGMLTVRVNRDTSRMLARVRGLAASVEIAGSSEEGKALKAELAAARDELDEVRYLGRSVQVKRANLRQTSADIKSILKVIEEQLRLGEVTPPLEQPLFNDSGDYFSAGPWPEEAVEDIADDEIDIDALVETAKPSAGEEHGGSPRKPRG